MMMFVVRKELFGGFVREFRNSNVFHPAFITSVFNTRLDEFHSRLVYFSLLSFRAVQIVPEDPTNEEITMIRSVYSFPPRHME